MILRVLAVFSFFISVLSVAQPADQVTREARSEVSLCSLANPVLSETNIAMRILVPYWATGDGYGVYTRESAIIKYPTLLDAAKALRKIGNLQRAKCTEIPGSESFNEAKWAELELTAPQTKIYFLNSVQTVSGQGTSQFSLGRVASGIAFN